MFLGKNLRGLRGERGMTVDNVIDMLAVKGFKYTRASYYKWESGQAEPGLKTIEALSEIFQTNVSYLLTGDGNIGFVLNEIESFILSRFRNDQNFRELCLALVHFRLKKDRLTLKQRKAMTESLNKLVEKYRIR